MSTTLKRDWTPHPAQREIMQSGHRFRVVAAGRRFGKTRLARGEMVERGFASPGSYIWYVAPSHGDAMELGFEALDDAIPESIVASRKKTAPPYIELDNGTRFSFRSADGKLRGRGLDFVVVDESGETPDGTWKQDLRPSLSDTGGSALFIGTPKGRNWFYDSHIRGGDDAFPEWTSFQFPTYANPHVPDEEVESARLELPERVFKQEYLAKFQADEGAVFGDVESRNALNYELDSVSGVTPYTIGVDLARQDAYTVVHVVDAEGLTVDWGRWRGSSWAAIGRNLKRIFERNAPGTAYMDANRDNAIIEQLARNVEGVQIERFNFTRSNKADIVENLAARLETGDVVFPESLTQLVAELKAYEYDTTAAGNVTYGPPESYHDDCVDAFALAAQTPNQPGSMGW